MTRRLYASDSEDNHEEPWTDGWDPAVCDAATGAAEYANEHGLGVGDHVYVIEASEDDHADTENPEVNGWPLVVHRSWKFRIGVVEVSESTPTPESP